jgi:hypothetical protein
MDVDALTAVAHALVSTLADVLPIAVILLFFQLVVLRRPIPHLRRVLVGLVYVVLGLALFLVGLEEALFPLGRVMARQLTDPAFLSPGAVLDWSDYGWVYAFAFAIGFSTTIAEPALIAVADEAARVAANGGMIGDDAPALQAYADGLRLTVAVSVGIAIVIGVFRIVMGWPIQYLIVIGYLGVVIMTVFAPREIIGIAYDSGGVTTSTITVPLVTALGVGLASSIRGRNPMVDGFGLIAFASLTPMIFVMGYGMLV